MPHTRVNLAAGDAPALPSAAALSDELKNATQDVEAVLREDRQLERQRDFRGVLGVFQGVGVRLFAVSVAKLLLLAAVFSSNASFVVWLMHRMSLAQALAVVSSADVVAALMIFFALFGRREPEQMTQRKRMLPGSNLSAAVERAISHTLLQYTLAQHDGGEHHHV